MKYEQSKLEFHPIAITLETQEEVDVLHALLGVAGGGYAGDFLYKLYTALGETSDSKGREYWTGALFPREG